MQAGPIVSQEDGIAGVRRIVFDAGNLAGRDARQMQAFFEAGDVLRRFVGHAGNRVGIVKELAR